MNAITHALAVVAILGSAMIGGVFFAFSSFVMKALARLPSSEGIVAMQSINVVVLNRSFLGVFMGTTVVSVLVAVLAITGWAMPSAPFFLAGALAYVAGTFLVTGLGNVPMNDQLAAVSASDPMAVAVWDQYLDRWTLLNTIRTVAAAAAALPAGTDVVRDTSQSLVFGGDGVLEDSAGRWVGPDYYVRSEGNSAPPETAALVMARLSPRSSALPNGC